MGKLGGHLIGVVPPLPDRSDTAACRDFADFIHLKIGHLPGRKESFSMTKSMAPGERVEISGASKYFRSLGIVLFLTAFGK